jgi:hypothetical protein
MTPPDPVSPGAVSPGAVSPGAVSPGAVSPDALRQLVREVLSDILPSLVNRPGPSFAPQASSPPAGPGWPETYAAPSLVNRPGPSFAPQASSPPAAPGWPGTYAAPSLGHQPGARLADRPTTPPTSVPRSDPSPAATPGRWDQGANGAHGTAGPHGASRAGGSYGAGGVGAAGFGVAATRSGVTLQPVRLATDAELHEFVLRVLALADNPKRRRDLLAGRLRFTLAAGGDPAYPAAVAPHGGVVPHGGAAPGSGDHRIEKGAVTERAVTEAARSGARLVLGPRAVLTPLARDRARALGVPIEKER